MISIDRLHTLVYSLHLVYSIIETKVVLYVRTSPQDCVLLLLIDVQWRLFLGDTHGTVQQTAVLYRMLVRWTSFLRFINHIYPEHREGNIYNRNDMQQHRTTFSCRPIEYSFGSTLTCASLGYSNPASISQVCLCVLPPGSSSFVLGTRNPRVRFCVI